MPDNKPTTGGPSSPGAPPSNPSSSVPPAGNPSGPGAAPAKDPASPGTPGKDPGTAPAAGPSTLTTKITGSLTIGTGANKTSFPVATTLPPPAGQKSWVFYMESDPDQATKINVADFIQWAIDAMSLGFTVPLPDSLKKMTVAIETLNFDTSGDNYDIKVEIGEPNSATPAVWTPSWKPVDALPLTLDNVTMEFSKGTLPPNPNAGASPASGSAGGGPSSAGGKP